MVKKGSQKIFFFFLILTLAAFDIKAQVYGMLEFTGKTTKNNAPLAGATVTVYRNQTIFQEQIKTGKNGKFRLFLVFGFNYKIIFSAPGCVDMHLLVNANTVKPDKNDIFPLYYIDIPFFDKNNTSVNIAKYKNPITKVIYDGAKAFKDDEEYLAQFTKGLLLTGEEQAKLIAEKEEKEKEEKARIEAEIKTKNEAAEKARKEAEEKLLAEKKAKAEELQRMLILEKLKEEIETAEPEVVESMETDDIKLQREKEKKELIAKKNREIKSNYQNDILKMVAENEKIEKQKSLAKQKKVAETYSVINKIKKETELKAKANELNKEIKEKQRKELENKQQKSVEMTNLVKAAAFAEKSIKIGNQKKLPSPTSYQRKKAPDVLVYVDEGVFKTTRVTTVIIGKKIDVYKKIHYVWSTPTYFKNDKPIDELIYNVEVAYYSAYKK